MNAQLRALLAIGAVLASLGCSDRAPELGALSTTCIAQVTGTYDSVLLARLDDSSLWAATSTSQFAAVADSDGKPLLGTDSAASGSSAYGAAVGCAIVDGGVYCFPLAGPLVETTGLGAGPDSATNSAALRVVTGPGTDAEPLADATQIAGGMNGGGATFCAVTSDSHVWCWGYNPNGLLGRDDAGSSSYARRVMSTRGTDLTGAVEARVGFDSACTRMADGRVWCWGHNDSGQLGSRVGDLVESGYPLEVPLPGAATRLAASPGNTHCALLEDTRVACWGRNEYAEAGAPSDALSVTPTVVQTALGGPDFNAAVDLAPDRGMRAMCANTENQGLWCWGDVLDDDPTGVGSPYPVQLATSPQGRISVPLSAYGARDGKLIYVNANGRLVLGAGSMPSSRQPPCAD